MKQWNQERWIKESRTGSGKMDGGLSAKAVISGTAPDTNADLNPGVNVDPGTDPDLRDAKRACDKAVYYLQFSGKTEYELRKKLAEQGFLPASVNKAVEFVKAYHYLDDEEYVRRYIEKNANKKSRKQMTGELYQKGITAEILDRGFEDMPVNEEEQILAIAKKRGFDVKRSGSEEKRKLFSYLARKGFSYDRIRAALDCRELWEDETDPHFF